MSKAVWSYGSSVNKEVMQIKGVYKALTMEMVYNWGS